MEFLQHFNLKELPFSLTPNLDFFCPLRNHVQALDTLLFHLDSGESLLKIVGEVGTGKTILCRKLLHTLATKDVVTCYILNPALDKDTLLRSIAVELGYIPSNDEKPFNIIEHIYQTIINHYQNGRRVVLVVDEAQALSEEGIETIRLLTNLETEKNKLLQVVLFGQPELDKNLSVPQLSQVRQRINFSYYLAPLTKAEMEDYVAKRLIKAGHTTGQIISPEASELLFKASNGILRLMHTLTYRAMLIAWEDGKHIIDKAAMQESVELAEDVYGPSKKDVVKMWVYGGCALYCLLTLNNFLPMG